MKKEYDFSKATRGVLRQLPPEEERARHTKVRITILLDQDILKFFKSRAAKPGAEPYQTQINKALRECITSKRQALKDNLLQDEDFITRVSERVVEYSTGYGVVEAPHSTLLRQAWESAQAASNSPRFRTHLENKDRDEWREAFQLFVACLIHSVSGLKKRVGKGFHEGITTIPVDEWITMLQRGSPPSFEENLNLETIFGNMHLASVSFRLATAVDQVHKKILKRDSPFKDATTRPDFTNRQKLADTYLGQTDNWGCCQTKSFDHMRPHDPHDALRLALVMVLLHRDHFGHGQEGQGSKKWNQARERFYKNLFRCRVAEAQLRLIQWGLSELARKV